MIPIIFAHFVGDECHEYWYEVFSHCENIYGFDDDRRTIIVDQEKSIDSAFRDALNKCKLFLDPLHVRKNMLPRLGASKANGIYLYNKAVHAPTKSAVDEIITQYSIQQAAYLSSLKKEEI